MLQSARGLPDEVGHLRHATAPSRTAPLLTRSLNHSGASLQQAQVQAISRTPDSTSGRGAVLVVSGGVSDGLKFVLGRACRRGWCHSQHPAAQVAPVSTARGPHRQKLGQRQAPRRLRQPAPGRAKALFFIAISGRQDEHGRQRHRPSKSPRPTNPALGVLCRPPPFSGSLGRPYAGHGGSSESCPASGSRFPDESGRSSFVALP